LLFIGIRPNIWLRGVSAMFDPIRKTFLLLAVGFLAIAGLAQSPPKYDPAAETKLKGTVEEFKFVPASGKPTGYLVVKSGQETVQIFLGPKSFLDDMGASFKLADAVEITGCKVKQDGADLILAREVVKGDDTLTLRFKDGKPAW
jgi:hypothetical protein